MPSDANHRYSHVPPIPTYDEAVAAGSSRTGFDGSDVPAMEARSLLRSNHQRSSSTATDPDDDSTVRSRRNRNGSGYRQPTVESDDEDSLWGADSLDDRAPADDDEAEHVRREMQELEMDDGASGRSRSSIFGKRIPFSLSLPQWRWNWRWHLPRLRIQLPNANPIAGRSSGGQSSDEAAPGDESTESSTSRWPRLRWPTMNGADACLMISRVIAIMVVMGFLYLLFMSDIFSSMTRRLFDAGSVRDFLQGHIDKDKIRDHVKHFSSYAHIAGSEGDYALAVDVKNMFVGYGLDEVSVDEYWTYINYPKAGGRAVEVLAADGSTQWAAKIEEEDTHEETAGRQTYVFHAHSKAGDVKGPLIYANYGTREDFKMLQDMGIDTKGAIALVRYYGPQQDAGLKVRAAELAGFAGCIIYSDPADDGGRRGEPAPNGRVMPADGAHRASVSLSTIVMGDPLTPGWASAPKDEPFFNPPSKSKGLVGIPSIPLAARDADPLLNLLSGHGKQVPAEWVGGLPSPKSWFTGDQSSPIVRLRNEQDEVMRKEIWNVYGRIHGYEQKAKKIIIGNRRDSLSFGATSPHSGTAVMMEVARVFGELRSRGWQPMRSIEFMSWDGGAFNMAGSTEFVEKNLASLRHDALAYINLDEAIGGGQDQNFRAAGNPVFLKLLLGILHRVGDPSEATTVNLRELWEQRNGELEGLGATSDYVAFQDLAGTSSLDIRFGDTGGDVKADGIPPPPRGSSYDNFDWMNAHGDPGFLYHGMLGEILSLLVVELADRPILPFDMEAYAQSLKGWAEDFSAFVGSLASDAGKLDFTPLQGAMVGLAASAKKFAGWEIEWETNVLSSSGFEPTMLGKRRAAYNERMGLFDSDLLDVDINEYKGGAPNRTQYKHVVFGPKLWNSDEAGYFPAVRDAVEAGDWPLAQKMLDKAVKLINDASAHLVE